MLRLVYFHLSREIWADQIWKTIVFHFAFSSRRLVVSDSRTARTNMISKRKNDARRTTTIVSLLERFSLSRHPDIIFHSLLGSERSKRYARCSCALWHSPFPCELAGSSHSFAPF
jgi:hypothetical protein